jgi:hypothetical protein
MSVQADPAVSPGDAEPDRIQALRDAAPVLAHFHALYGDVRFGAERFTDLFMRAAQDSDTDVYVRNLIRRAAGGINLIRYFLATFGLPGGRCECGVFRGLSALTVCRAAQAVHGPDAVQNFHLVDSFERFSPARPQDMVAVRAADGTIEHRPPFPAGSRLDTSIDHVRSVFAGIPGVSLVQGWVPQVLATLPEQPWAFVHLDVDLYEPTRGALEYFWPRLCFGAVVVTDDYGSAAYPGCRKAWDEFCDKHRIPFVQLGTGQAVIVRA